MERYLFSSVVDVLEDIGDSGIDALQRAEAFDILDIINKFEFVFILHLMKNILGITHELSQVLQRKDQDIVNAMSLVKVSKTRLQLVRDEHWDTLLAEVSDYCIKHEISMINMEELYVARGRSRRRVEKNTNLHHYRVDLFYSVIDMQVQELNLCFNEVNTELHLCMSCFDPKDSFSAFDKNKLLQLARYYPSDITEVALLELESQLENFIVDVCSDYNFSNVVGIGGLAHKIVATNRHILFPLVYLLLKLSLILPVATATVERTFSAMKFIKTSLRNKMGDALLNDCLVAYIEKDVFRRFSNESIMQGFQNMKNRRGIL